MRTVFILPPQVGLVARSGRRHNRSWPPLDLLNCAALTREYGAHAAVLDFRSCSASRAEFMRLAHNADLVFVTTSALDRWQCPNLDITDTLRFITDLPSDRTIVMGAHGTMDPGWVLKETRVRAVIRREPETAVQKLIQGIPIEGVCGISYLKDGEVFENPDCEVLDLTSLPLPAYDLIDLKDYSYELLGERLALLETTRGCNFSCKFCFKKMYGKGVRKKEKDQIFEEIEFVVKKQRAHSIYFFDLEFTQDLEIVEYVCQKMKVFKGRVKWCCQTRPDLVDKSLLNYMAGSGCELIHYGIESGSERILDLVGKKTNLEGIKRAITETHSAGIRTACFFLFGFPGETDEERRETVAFAKQLNPTYASFHTVTAYPGTTFYHSMSREKRPGTHPRKPLEIPNLDRFIRRAFFSYYLRPAYLLQCLFGGNRRLWIHQARLLWEFIK